MKQRSKIKQNDMNISGWITGIFSAILISALCLLGAPLLVMSGHMDPEALRYVFIIVHGLAVFTGAYIASRRAQGNKLIEATLVSGIYFLLLLCISIIFFEGVSEWIWSSLLGCLIALASAVFVSLKGRKYTKIRKRA